MLFLTSRKLDFLSEFVGPSITVFILQRRKSFMIFTHELVV